MYTPDSYVQNDKLPKLRVCSIIIVNMVNIFQKKLDDNIGKYILNVYKIYIK